jgi:hypothetical protein
LAGVRTLMTSPVLPRVFFLGSALRTCTTQHPTQVKDTLGKYLKVCMYLIDRDRDRSQLVG